MSLRAHFQPGATIVQVRGVIEAVNAARLRDYLDDIAGTARPLILDLRGVDFFSGDGLCALVGIAGNSPGTDSRRALVTGDGLGRLLRSRGNDRRLPIVGSVEDALQLLASSDPARFAPHRVTHRSLTRC